MKPMRPSRRLVLWLMLLPLVVSTACLAPLAGTPPTPTQAVVSASSTPAGSGPAPVASATTSGGTPPAGSPTPAETALAAPLTFGPGAFELTDTTTGLADLSSYTATLSVSFDGKRSGQPVQSSKTTVMRASTQPAARQVTTQINGDAAPRLMLAEVDSVAYQRRGDQACTAGTTVPGNGLADRYEPARSLSPVVGADEAGSETVNGIPAKHYTFDERALGQAGFSKSTGELWVAAQGDYIVKYLLTTQAGPDFFGSGSEGNLRWDYELTGANQPVSIEVPQDCPAGLIDVPLLPDAANVRSLPGVLSYDTAAKPPEAGAFYKDKLPALGWELASTALITDTAALLVFSHGHGNLLVTAKPQPDHTTIEIVQTR